MKNRCEPYVDLAASAEARINADAYAVVFSEFSALRKIFIQPIAKRVQIHQIMSCSGRAAARFLFVLFIGDVSFLLLHIYLQNPPTQWRENVL